jgi:hypothetical protein
MPILRATRRPTVAASRPSRASRTIPAASARSPSPATADGASCCASAARCGVGTPREAFETGTGKSRTIARAAGRVGTDRSCGTVSAVSAVSAVALRASADADETRLAGCVPGWSFSARAAVPCTTCAPDVAAASAPTADTSAVEVAPDVPCVDAATGRTGASNRNAPGRATDAGPGVSAVSVPTAGEVDSAIVIPASSAPCCAGVVDGGAALSGEAPVGAAEDVDGVAVADCADAVAVTAVGGAVGAGESTGDGVGGDGGWTATGAAA